MRFSDTAYESLLSENEQRPLQLIQAFGSAIWSPVPDKEPANATDMGRFLQIFLLGLENTNNALLRTGLKREKCFFDGSSSSCPQVIHLSRTTFSAGWWNYVTAATLYFYNPLNEGWIRLGWSSGDSGDSCFVKGRMSNIDHNPFLGKHPQREMPKWRFHFGGRILFLRGRRPDSLSLHPDSYRVIFIAPFNLQSLGFHICKIRTMMVHRFKLLWGLNKMMHVKCLAHNWISLCFYCSMHHMEGIAVKNSATLLCGMLAEEFSVCMVFDGLISDLWVCPFL